MRYKKALITPLTLYTAIHTPKCALGTYYDISASSSEFICPGASIDSCTIHCDQKEEKEQLYNFDCGSVNTCYFQCEHPDCLGGTTPGTIDASSANNLFITVSGDNCMNGATVYTPSNGDATFSINGAMGGLKGLTIHSGINTNNIQINCVNSGTELKEEKEACKSMVVDATNAQYLQIDVSMPFEEGTIYCPSYSIYESPCIINANKGGTFTNINIYAKEGTPKGVDIIDNDDAKIDHVTVFCDSGTSTYPFVIGSDCVNTVSPTRKPTMYPTKHTHNPTKKPTERPTSNPTKKPTNKPTKSPTKKPTLRPTNRPTNKPSRKPSEGPTRRPSKRPTNDPTKSPSKQPTFKPSKSPTKKPTDVTAAPTLQPSSNPTFTVNPSMQPTLNPSKQPTVTLETLTPSTEDDLQRGPDYSYIWTIVGYLAAVALLLVIICMICCGICYIRKSCLKEQRIHKMMSNDTYDTGQTDMYTDTVPIIQNSNVHRKPVPNIAHMKPVPNIYQNIQNNNAPPGAIYPKPVPIIHQNIPEAPDNIVEGVEMAADREGGYPISPMSSSSDRGLFGTYKTKGYTTVIEEPEPGVMNAEEEDIVYNERTLGFID